VRQAWLLLLLIVTIAMQSCHRDPVVPGLAIPNGDFEAWTSYGDLQTWKTDNSCFFCANPILSVIVQQSDDAYHGHYAAKFVYNNIRAATASNKFSIASHPSALTGFVKCELYGNDTVSVKIEIFNGTVVVDSGLWLSTSTINRYTPFSIPLTRSFVRADSALVIIKGGDHFDTTQGGSVLWVDDLSLH
jgi:hypothetical protein